jgi:hypothetical protein
MSAKHNLNDTELLSAYMDGQLTIEERSALESRLQTDAELRYQLALLRATVDLIRDLPQLKAPRDFTLTRQMVGTRGNIRRLYTFSLLSAAAAVVLLFVGFGLLSARMYGAATNGFSRAASNFEPDGNQQEIAAVPTDGAFSIQIPLTVSADPGFFAPEESTQRGADLESEMAGEQAQQAQTTLSQLFMTSTAPAASIQTSPIVGAADEVDDASTSSTTGEETAEDGRLRDTQQAESQSESMPAPALPSDALAQPSQDAAGAMQAMQPTLAPPTSTPQPTLLPTRTALPTETASFTATRTLTQTIAPTATSTPTPPPEPRLTAEPTDVLAVVFIVVAVILLVAAISAIVINRRR